MAYFRFTTLVLTLFISSDAFCFDDLRNRWTLDFLYHYTRLERSTLTSTENFLSRQGGMMQFEYEIPLTLFTRYYLGGDVALATYEASANTSFSPRQMIPWQLYGGAGFQFGTLKSLELFLGVGAASEQFFVQNLASYSFQQKLSGRIHGGVSWRLLSMVGASASLLFRYSLPFTKVDHNGTDLTFAGILDASLRLRSRYDSSWSLYGGVRFEDYETTDKSVSYFTSRIYAGLGLHF